MSIAINDPAFDLPDVDFLNPTFPWTETPDEPEDGSDPVVTVAIVVARALPSNHRAVLRGEIVASPAYVKACHGRMIDRDALGALLVELGLGGHRVVVERREVKCDLGTILSLQNNE